MEMPAVQLLRRQGSNIALAKVATCLQKIENITLLPLDAAAAQFVMKFDSNEQEVLSMERGERYVR